jgi:DNA-binding NarL/FixJ family response regulator
VANEIASGRSHKEIARLLSVSPNTVRNHTQTVLGKLGVHSRTQLATLIHNARSA